VKHGNKINLNVHLSDMGLLGSNYRQVQEKIKRLVTDSSFDNSGGTTI